MFCFVQTSVNDTSHNPARHQTTSEIYSRSVDFLGFETVSECLDYLSLFVAGYAYGGVGVSLAEIPNLGVQ